MGWNGNETTEAIEGTKQTDDITTKCQSTASQMWHGVLGLTNLFLDVSGQHSMQQFP